MTPGTQAMKNVFASSTFHTLAEDGFFQTLFFKGRGATENAGHTDDLYIWLWWFCLAWFIFLMVLMTYFVIKYRRRKGKISQVSSSHNTPLEVAWTVIPTLMLVYIFFQGFRGYMSKVVAPGEAIEINLNGQQWFWSMTYPNGAESTSLKLIGAKASPVFYMPADVPIRLRMNSRDVMHAFWITDFRIKQDVVPNRYTTMWFQAGLSKNPKMHPKDAVEAKAMDMEFIAELVGVPYEDHIVFCAEYCGNEHAEMAATIRLVPYDAWKSWLTYIESPSNKTPAEIGQFVWKTKCASCHSIDGTAGTGSSWKDLYGRMAKFTDGTEMISDENYIRESILYPSKHIVMGYGPNMPLIALKERQLEGVIAYMKSISSNPLAKEGAAAKPEDAAKPQEKK